MDSIDTDPLSCPKVGSEDIMLYYLYKAQDYIKKTTTVYLAQKDEAKVRQKEMLKLSRVNQDLVLKIENLTKETKQIQQKFEMRSPSINKRRKTASTDRSDISNSPFYNSSVTSSDFENQENHSSLEELNENISNMTTVEHVKSEPLSPSIKQNQNNQIHHQKHSKRSSRKNLDMSAVVIPETELNAFDHSPSIGKSVWISKDTAKKGKTTAFLKPICLKTATTSSKDRNMVDPSVSPTKKKMRQQTLLDSFSIKNTLDIPSSVSLKNAMETDTNQTYCEDLEFLVPKPKNDRKVNQSLIHSQLLQTVQKIEKESGDDDCSIIEELRLIKEEHSKDNGSKQKYQLNPTILRKDQMETPDIFDHSNSDDELFRETDSLIFVEHEPSLAISINSTIAENTSFAFDVNDNSIDVLEERVLKQAATPQLDPSKKIKFYCKECEKAYNFNSLTRSTEELAKMDFRCIYHKKHPILRAATPEGFWDAKFTETQ